MMKHFGSLKILLCVMVLVFFVQIVAAQQDVSGIWQLTAQGTSVGCTTQTPCQPFPPNVCGTDICSSFQMGDSHIQVTQSGTTLTASEEDIHGNPFSLDGVINGQTVTFTISGDGITPDIGRTTTTYTGTLTGNVVTGQFHGFASWQYVDVNGKDITETATMTGTFSSEIYQSAVATCDFSTQPGIVRCFGGVGSGCSGNAMFFAPFTRNQNTCMANGWMSAGSIAHDKCCSLTDNAGYYCRGPFTNVNSRDCRADWNEAQKDATCGHGRFPKTLRQWPETFGPYPFGNPGDNVAIAVKAPAGVRVFPPYSNVCPSGGCKVNSTGTDACGQYCVCQ